MKKKFLVSLFILISLILNLTSALPAHAQTVQQSLQVSPIIQEVTLVPGHETQYTLTITNLSDTPLGIHADVSGITLDTDTPSTFQPTQDSLLSQWTRIVPQDVLIPEKSKKTMTVRINPPEHAQKSGYYTGIILTPFLNQQKLPGKPIVLSRIVALTIATIGTLNYNDLAQKAHVQDFHFSRFVYDSSWVEAIFTVKNAYFTHFSAQPVLTITPLFGKKIIFEPIEKHILPGKSRTWNIPVDVPANHLFYNAHIAVSIGDGKQLTADTFFFVLPYKTIALLFMVLALLLGLTVLRKRIAKALRILVESA